MNLPRRLQVLGGVVVASAAAGATAGLLLAGLMLATKMGHARPSLAWELIKLGSQTGAVFGGILGPPAMFGLLRRVPLGRLALSTFLGTAYGGALGFSVSMAFAQPRPTILLTLLGSVAGFGLAVMHVRSRTPSARHSNRVPLAG